MDTIHAVCFHKIVYIDPHIVTMQYSLIIFHMDLIVTKLKMIYFERFSILSLHYNISYSSLDRFTRAVDGGEDERLFSSKFS